MSETLNVEKREVVGKRRVGRLREQGIVPAVLYGHGEANLNLQLPEAEIVAAVKAGNRVVDLKGALTEKAFIKELQWDVFGNSVLHLDLERVSLTEKKEVELPVELKGEAPGAGSGVVEQHVYKVEIRVSIANMPEKLFLNVSSLNVGGHLTASQITLPEGAELLTEAETVVVECHERKEVDLDTTPALPSEPEVIKREKKEEDKAE